MSSPANLRRVWTEFLCAIQFLTRVPVPSQPYEADALSRAVKFFPLVGLLIGASGALLHFLLAPHLPSLIVAVLILSYFVCITGCLHEDGLADAADGFGGGWSREQILIIMHDSRIGSYGAAALTLSLGARLLLISALPLAHVGQYLVAAHVLCRWTTLPLSYYLPPARAKRGSNRRPRRARSPTHGSGNPYRGHPLQLRNRRRRLAHARHHAHPDFDCLHACQRRVL